MSVQLFQDAGAMKHLFIINPRSFPAPSDLEREIRDCFAERKEEFSIHVSRYPRDAIGYVRRCMAPDIIHCGTNYALNFCTLGIESDTIMGAVKIYKNLAPRIRKYKKINSAAYSLLYYLCGSKSLFNKKLLRQHYDITIDEGDFSGVYASINIANGPCYGNDKLAVPTAMHFVQRAEFNG